MDSTTAGAGMIAATRARLLIAILVGTLAVSTGLAQGQDSGGTPSGGVGGDGSSKDGSYEEPSGDSGFDEDSSPGGEETTDPGGRIELKVSNAKPAKAFAEGDDAVYHYELAGRRSRDLEVQVVSKRTRDVVRSFRERAVEPKQGQRLAWNGKNNRGRLADEGEYRFRVTNPEGEKADTSRADGKSQAGFYKHKFPVRGRHNYGDGVGADRGHRGQDVFAKCGTRLVAAHAGKVQHKAFDGSAGYYLVIDGRRTSMDYVYMHLRDKASVREGERVKTGEPIGRVGDSGNASGCHLHFELWSKPGWYDGGRFMRSVTRQLKRWDRWS